jgi:5'-AMP-activated protein kinase catalytic alpha subunit
MKRIKELEACKFFQQIIAGVEYIHQMKIVHRSLKLTLLPK